MGLPGRAAEGPLQGEPGWGQGSRSGQRPAPGLPAACVSFRKKQRLDRKPVRSIPSLMQQDMCGLAFIHTHTCTHAASPTANPQGPRSLALGHLLQTEHLRYEKLTQTQACPGGAHGRQPLLTPDTGGPTQPTEDGGAHTLR